MEHSFDKEGFHGSLGSIFGDDYEGEVQIWAKLNKWLVPGRDCGGIPKTPDKRDDPCESCENSYKKRARNFEIKYKSGNSHLFSDLEKKYVDLACNPNFTKTGASIPDTVVKTQGAYGFSCYKDWFECGTNTRLEEAITPGQKGYKKLDFDQTGTANSVGFSDDRKEYDIVCGLYKMFLAAKTTGTKCAECELLCLIINSTIFGDIGSKSGGKPSDCDYIGTIPGPTGVVGEEVCEIDKGWQFEYWLDQVLDFGTKDPGPPFVIEECPGCPGCD